jgi:hypothetical protein
MPLVFLLPLALAADDPSAFTASVQGELSARFLECAVDVAAPLALHLTCGKTELDLFLDRLYRSCDRGPSVCADEKSLYYATVAQSFAPDEPVTLDRVLPAVRTEAWVASIPEAAREHVIVEPLAGELRVVWMADFPQTTRTLRPELLPELGLTPATLRSGTRANLDRELALVGDTQVGDHHLLGGSWYASSALVDLARWPALAGEGTLLSIVPAHDVLLYTTSPRAGARRKMERAAERFYRASQNPLSTQVLRWTGEGWAAE